MGAFLGAWLGQKLADTHNRDLSNAKQGHDILTAIAGNVDLPEDVRDQATRTLFDTYKWKPSDWTKKGMAMLDKNLQTWDEQVRKNRAAQPQGAPAPNTSLSSQPMNVPPPPGPDQNAGGAFYGPMTGQAPSINELGQRIAPQVLTAPIERGAPQFQQPAPPPGYTPQALADQAMNPGGGELSRKFAYDPQLDTLQAEGRKWKEFIQRPGVSGLSPEEQVNAYNKQYVGPRGNASAVTHEVNPGNYLIGPDGKVIFHAPPAPPNANAAPTLRTMTPGSVLVNEKGEVVYTAPQKEPTDRVPAGELGARLEAERILASPDSKPHEIKAAKATLADLERKASQPSDSQNLREMNRLDRNYQANSKALETVGKPVTDMVMRLSRLEDTLNQGTPQADALLAPELLTVMAGGAGSGLRMNEAEIARIVGGRSKMETLRATLQQWQLDPSKANSITPAQRQQMRALVSTVREKVNQKQAVLDEAQQSLLENQDPQAQRRIVASTRKKFQDIDARSVVSQGQPLTREEAINYLKRAGGDKDKARALARAEGRSF